MAEKLVRDPQAVRKSMKRMPDGRVLCTQDLRIQILERYTECNLAQISIETTIYGICALLLPDGKYSVMLVHAMLNIDPAKILKVEIDGDMYYEFHFKANTPWLKSSSLVKNGDSLFYLTNDFIFHSKIPWYVEYDDLGKLFDSTDYYAGAPIASSYTTIEFIASMVARNPQNKQQYYRMVATDKKVKPSYVPLMSVYYSASNTLNKLAGNYFASGVVSALVNPAQTTEKLDKLLRA